MQASNETPAFREIDQIIRGINAADGDGVKLTRLIGSSELNHLDPFLLFDAFHSDKAEDYIGGFPPHPHRGFETVTYMLEGKMRHQDSAGNQGVIGAGDVQWMTAGRGIIHSEMPEQVSGMLAGFQLWVNLPAAQKMIAPQYQEKSSQQIPVEKRGPLVSLKVISGTTQNGTQGIIDNLFVDPIYWDIKLSEQADFVDQLPIRHNAFIYVIEGEISIGSSNAILTQGHLATLRSGHKIKIVSQKTSRVLLIAGKPLHEPIKRAGPFVMNTDAQLQQAFADYQSGQFG